jgi:hypothetical protein
METQIEQSKRPYVIEVGRGLLIGASIGHGILGFIGGLLLFYFKSGERAWGKLLAESLGVGVFVAVISYMRAGFKKQLRVTVDESGVQIENEKERVVLSWGEIEGVSHWVHGGDYWEFRSQHRPQPVVLKGLCFDRTQCKQLTAAIAQFKEINEEQPGMKRVLEDAFVH